MRRLLLALSTLIFPALLLPAVQSGEKPDKPTSLLLTWHGHSFFTIKTSKGTIVAFDPHAIQQYGRLEGLKADIILISHNHNDHTQIGVFDGIAEALKNKTVRVITGLKGPGLKADWADVDEKIKDVRIRNVHSFHDSIEGMKYGKNSIFIVEVDGWKICHLGDLGHTLSPEQVKKIGPVDVLMVPVGGIYTLNGSEAKEVVDQLMPKNSEGKRKWGEYVFPMHYGTKVFDELLPIREFLEEQERAKTASSDDNKILLNRDPNRPRPLMVQLNFWPKGKSE
ncbi:MAG: MBL fold metallo-hydrolase [Planctomycetes bacterium]|nr:MBL fold metallo-hydrolase [Planctomycetota bacterium]